MLKRIRIQNFAIIDEVAIDFGEGLNIISGETGAGKSILMDALALILGGRASADLIRTGAEEATVEALFELDRETSAALDAQGFRCDDGDLIVRRIVHRSGKNRIFVNGTMATMAALHAVTASLVDLCSQHDQQLLARPEEQLLWVDRYGELEKEREEVRALHATWREKAKALEDLHTDSAQRAQRIDFLRFQIQELDDAAVTSPTEDEELQKELKVLGNAENLFAFVAEAEGLLEQLGGVSTVLQRAHALAPMDPKLAGAIEQLTPMKLHAEELGFFLRDYGLGLSRDENRLEELNARLALLGKLKRKYGPSLGEVVENHSLYRQELAQLENHDSASEAAREEAARALARLTEKAKKLSTARARKAKEFSSAVVKELGELHMGRARFQAALTPLEAPNATGLDALRFEIAANPGEAMGPMSKVASGGELSRIMLAMHNVVSSRGQVGVFLFDEVDTGIGGTTAGAVGAKLRRVADRNQVICITHLPQVAAHGQHQFRVDKLVEKRGKEERTVCRVLPLSPEERELEIARMLGGLGNHAAAIANARAMLDSARGVEKKAKVLPLTAKKAKAAPGAALRAK